MTNYLQSIPVSVVIPCFNSELTIERAINSVFCQLVRPKEIVIVDDCSSDNTLQVLQSIKLSNPEIINIIKIEKNCGAASARNIGWNVASQLYIAFLDADDSWHPEKLKIQYNYMLNNPEITLCGTKCAISTNENTKDSFRFNLRIKKITSLSMLFKNPFNTPTVMVKRDIAFRFNEGQRFAEDILLWLQIGFSGYKVARIEEFLAYVYKPFYGKSGLSDNLFEMEKFELNNFIKLYKEGHFKILILMIAVIFSVLKFLKRLFFSSVKRFFEG
jgi:glycosyltransferase involved in cell wall biosynthesis